MSEKRGVGEWSLLNKGNCCLVDTFEKEDGGSAGLTDFYYTNMIGNLCKKGNIQFFPHIFKIISRAGRSSRNLICYWGRCDLVTTVSFDFLTVDLRNQAVCSLTKLSHF